MVGIVASAVVCLTVDMTRNSSGSSRLARVFITSHTSATWTQCIQLFERRAGVPTTFEDTSSELKWGPNVAALWVALLRGPGLRCGFGNWLDRSRSLHENTSVVSQIILRAFPSTPVPIRDSFYHFTVSVENFVTWPKDTLSSVV
jgi:hypothetical protein